MESTHQVYSYLRTFVLALPLCKTLLSQIPLYEFSAAAITNYTSLQNSNDTDLFFYSSGGPQSKIKVLAELHSSWKTSEDNLPASLPFLIPRDLPSLCL